MRIHVSEVDFLKKLPKLPGVYRFYATDTDENGGLLYVGKAIDLHNRVKTYFQKGTKLSPRISLMVKRIKVIEITITPNEVSALVLENNLIKNLKPKYNILFRDDKTYPLIRLTKHDFPKIEYYRGRANNTDKFFGPYPNSHALRQSIEMVNKLFRIRTCSDSEFNNRSRPCMLYQIKRCDAPCVNKITQIEYAQQVKLAMDFLQGKYNVIVENLTRQMSVYAENYEFEKAAAVRDKIAIINQLTKNQFINNYKKPISADIMLYQIYQKKCIIYLIMLRNGIYVGDRHYIIDLHDEPIEVILRSFIESHYLETLGVSVVYTDYIFPSEFIELIFSATSVRLKNKFPSQVGALIEMGHKNIENIVIEIEGTDRYVQAANDLALLLKIPEVKRIECIDISHNHGEDTIASLVVYENGVIDHKQYRRYNLRESMDQTVINGDDLLAIKTILKRRFNNLKLNLPDVILIDGGVLQYDIVKNTLNELSLYDKIRVIALYKGERRDPLLDTLYISSSLKLSFSDNKILFRLLQNLRDEAHRFAITGHRKKQIKKMVVSKLNDIPLIGLVKKQALIAKFGSVKEIAQATIDELRQVEGIGEKLARQIYDYFH